MRLALAADLHGVLPEIPPADGLLLAGDICPDGPEAEMWLRREFLPWLDEQPPALLVAGNHDRALGKIHPPGYLEDSLGRLGRLRIWGTPWSNVGREWAFQREDLHRFFSLIPEDIDILLTHIPPGGVLDSFHGTSLGSPELSARLQKSAPGLVVFGHIHEWASQSKRIGNTLFVNAGIHADRGKRVGPLVVELRGDRWEVF